MMAILAVHDGPARARMPKLGATSFLLCVCQRIGVANKMVRKREVVGLKFPEKVEFSGLTDGSAGLFY